MKRRDNRRAGHNYERAIVNELKEMGFGDVVTARSESRSMDNAGVDIFGDDLQVYIQCKCSTTQPNFHQLFSSERLPQDKPLVVFFKKVHKANKRFVTDGEYVIMKKELFSQLLLSLSQMLDLDMDF